MYLYYYVTLDVSYVFGVIYFICISIMRISNEKMFLFSLLK